MGNLISLAIAGTAAFAAAPLTTAAQSAGEPGATPTDAAVFADFGRETGKMRPELHSSGFGPLICSCPQSTINDIRAMGFKASRTHDWALLNSAERVCDYYHIFPLPHLDATDPANYVFGPAGGAGARVDARAGRVFVFPTRNFCCAARRKRVG